ncbi:hypothetical protein [Legionella fallonii]|uniref:Uncharacterized protein n=1 Tax=Legionella fallonii LLAP-10 TaxID=1212491 RepID=A0A098G9N7_9GAMM|nr:hypothetical protein [Legionella fallonii]CEG58710.1 protein of unknown function [Legionella fallonii LLAP-10]
MFGWLATTLVDAGWVKTGLAFRWLIGTENLMYALTNETDLQTIKRRYQLIEDSGFFSGEQELSRKQAFLKSLFTYDAYETDAYSKALSRFYSWNGGNINPLRELLDFIKALFFQGPYAQELKQTFIEATFISNNGEHNSLAHTAWPQTKSTKAEENPLALLLNTLDEAGCFTGPKTAENQHRFVTALAAQNHDGENALSQSLQHINFGSSLSSLAEKVPNFQLLIERVQTHCLGQGEDVQKNKEIFINGLLHKGRLRRTLEHAMFIPEVVAFIFKFIEQAGYFSQEENKQALFDRLVDFDLLNRSVLYHASRNKESLKLVSDQLKSLGCLNGSTGAANKEKLIKAIISPNNDGQSALSEAKDQEVTKLQLELLEEADCFKNDDFTQQFINAVFVKDRYGSNCLYHLSSRKEHELVAKLKAIKFLEGPNAKANQANFIAAVLSKNTLNGESALFANCHHESFNFLMEHLTLAGCFSGPDKAKYQQQFIDAIFAANTYGSTIMSRIYRPETIILLLQKLAEAGCFTSATNKNAFIDAIKSDDNRLVFNCMNSLKAYLALRKHLKEAGFSAQELKNLLNQPVTDEYGLKKNTTPYMSALENGDGVLIELLKKDGAELTEEQSKVIAQQQKQIAKWKQEKPEFNREKVTKRLKAFQTEQEEPKNPAKKSLRLRPRLERRASFSEISSGITLFDKANKEIAQAQDDSVLTKKSSFS